MTTGRTAVSACTIGPMRALGGLGTLEGLRALGALEGLGALGALGIVLLTLSVAAVGWAAVTDRIARRMLADMNRLLLLGHHGQVLDHPQPPWPYRVAGNRVRATSALLTGLYARTLQLLDHPVLPARLRPSLGDMDLMLRGGALIGLGRYLDAAAVLGENPTPGIVRHLRAQVAMETGDDVVALRLLAVPDTDPDEDAGRRRILGELHIRRQRLVEGEALVREAQRLYLGSELAAHEVDAGYCELHLGQAALHRGDGGEAVRRISTAREMLTIRPDNAPGIALVELNLAEAHALTGAERAADAALTAARGHAQTMASPAVDAALERAIGMVGVHLARPDAGTHLRRARAMHEALGERPQVDVIDEVLRRLGTYS